MSSAPVTSVVRIHTGITAHCVTSWYASCPCASDASSAATSSSSGYLRAA
jgi:hypothetical protein